MILWLSMSPHAASPKERAAVAPSHRQNVSEQLGLGMESGSLFSDLSDVLLLHLEPPNTAQHTMCYSIWTLRLSA